jgi:hypothetical protein
MPSSIEEILSDLKIEVTSVGDKEIGAHCPFHADNHPSFYISSTSGLWMCHSCGRGGPLEILIEQISGEKIDPEVYLREIRHNNLGVNKKKEKAAKETDYRLLVARYNSFKRPPAWALESRMIDPEIAEEYGIRWDHGWILPLFDPHTHALWGWQFKQLKFVSNYPKSIKKSLTLFGIRELRNDWAALVESPLDVARLASADVPAVASFGAFVSQVQIELISSVVRELVIALDADEEGQRQADKVYKKMAPKIPVTKRVDFPKGIKDPGDMSDKQVERVFL